MRRPAPKLSLFVLALLALVLGVSLRGPALSPDGPLPWSSLFGAFLVFAFFSYALLCWGGLLARSIGLQPSDLLARLALGTAAASFAGAALGHLGLIGYGSPAIWACVLAGPVADTLWKPRERFASLNGPRRDRVELAVGLGLVALVGLATAKAFFPDGHPDPLFYHLLAPRVWVDTGRIAFPAPMPILLMSGSWDYLHLWGQSLLGAEGGGGLVEGMLFGQWAHALLGYGGAVLAMLRLSSRFTRSRRWAGLAALAAASCASMTWITGMAKNDWGAAFWLLAGTALLLSANEREERSDAPLAGRPPARSSTAAAPNDLTVEEGLGSLDLATVRPPALIVTGRQTLAAGALLGLAFATKTTSGFALVPLALLVLCRVRHGPDFKSRIAMLLLGALVGFLPIALRNAWWTGNPIFPSLNRLFPGPVLSPSWSEYLRLFEPGGLSAARQGLDRVALLWRQSPLILALPLPPLFSLLQRRPVASLGLWGAGTASLVLFLVGSGPLASLRLLGAGNLLIAAACVLALEEVTLRLPRAAQAAAFALVAGATLFFSSAPWRAPLQLAERPPVAQLIRHASGYVNHPPVGGDARAWLRKNADDGALIASLDDNRFYFVSHLPVVGLREERSLEEQIATTPDTQLVPLLRSRGFRYLLEVTDWRGPFRRRLAARFGPILDQAPEATVFRGEGCRVVDLALMR